mgnify:CR=1 FL=1
MAFRAVPTHRKEANVRYVPAIVIAVGVTIATLFALYLTNDVSSLNGSWGMLLAVWAANVASNSKVAEEHEKAFWSRDEDQRAQ